MSGWYSRPILHVSNVQRSIEFYIDKLGFTESWRYEGEGNLLVAQVEREGCVLICSSQWPDKAGKGIMFISLDNVDTVRAELEKRGAPVRDGRWGYRLMIVDDPDGNQLFFSYPAESV